MDIPLLDTLSDEAPALLLDDPTHSPDPFLPSSDPYISDPDPTPSPEDTYLFLSPDPFLTDPGLQSDPHPKPELLLHSFDLPAMPPSVPASLPPSNTPAPAPPPHDAGQENRARVGNGVEKRDRPRAGAVKKGPVKKLVATVPSKKAPKLEEDDVKRVKDKLAQRKLRNKESARRYREKQVARRKQLENYTRTLTEQNRELENLHDRLLTITCERSINALDAPLAQVARPGVLSDQ